MDTLRAVAESIAHAGTKLDRDAERPMWRAAIEHLSHDGKYLHLRVVPTAEQLQAHQAPGQYVVATFDDARPRFIALGTPPGAAHWDLMFEPKPEWNLAQFAPGNTIALSAPEGPGFPVVFEHGSIVVFVTGSAIASVLPWLESQHARGEDITVFYTPTPNTPQTLARLEACVARAGCVLTLCEFTELLDEADHVSTDAVVLLASSPTTMQSLAHRLLVRGIDPARIHTNT